MPRPGPRPYECVRRAWHSDRHQPMRGSLIQEIFRLANEVHSAATKKNKEWQEKLPIVVLKAEEIMYSKANSEAEYVDLKTLQERVNDAIDTIIRRDEMTEAETCDLLQPCIEAALVLGCVPRRASRSQRHSNPRCYLSSSPQETDQASVLSTRITERTTYCGPMLTQPINSSSNPSPQCMPYYSTIVTPSTGNTTHLVTALSHHKQMAVPTLHSDFRSMSNRFHHPCQDNAVDSSVICPSLHCRIYPLYYISDQANNMQSVSELRSDSRENLFDLNDAPDAWKSDMQTCSNVVGPSKELVKDGSDLSLRLGLPSNLDSQMENRWNSERLDIESNSFCEASGLFDPSRRASDQFDSSSIHKEKEFLFFPSADHT